MVCMIDFISRASPTLGVSLKVRKTSQKFNHGTICIYEPWENLKYIFYDDEMPEEWYNMREINILKLAEKKIFWTF